MLAFIDGLLNRERTWSGMDENPNVEEIDSESNGAGIAPAIAKDSSTDFQKIEGNSIASGYMSGIDEPTEIAHNF